MFLSQSAVIFCVVGTVQALGLGSVALARLTEGSTPEVLCQRLYVIFLLAIGVLTLATVFVGNLHWISFGATLSLMALGGTLDLGGTRRAVI